MKKLSLIALMACLLASGLAPAAYGMDHKGHGNKGAVSAPKPSIFDDLLDGFNFPDSSNSKDFSLASSLALTLLLRMIPEGIAINALNNPSEEAVKTSALALGIENAVPVVLGGVTALSEVGIFLSNLARNASSGTLTAEPRHTLTTRMTQHNIPVPVTMNTRAPNAGGQNADGLNAGAPVTVTPTVSFSLPEMSINDQSTVYQGYDINNSTNKYKGISTPLRNATTLLALSSPFAYNVYSNWQKAKTGKEREIYLKQTAAALTKMTSLKKKQWMKLVFNSLLLFGSGYLLIGSTSNIHNNRTSDFDNVMDRFNNSLDGFYGNRLVAFLGALGLAAGIKLEYDRTSERSKLLDNNFRFTEEELKEPVASSSADDDDDITPAKPAVKKPATVKGK